MMIYAPGNDVTTHAGSWKDAAMKVILKERLFVVIAESDNEKEAAAPWVSAADGHVFVLKRQDDRTFRMVDLGPLAEACREPINVTSRSSDPQICLISNLAHTPFKLDGRFYASVEAFWQGLKFPDEAKRAEIAALHGHQARLAGAQAEEAEEFQYDGRRVRTGTFDHWQLMHRACLAKFEQNAEANAALLSTGERPLEHIVRRDSKNIPGVIMAGIWMKIRSKLANQTDDESSANEG